MSNMSEIVRCGKELGLGGDELRIFVEEERRRLEKENQDKIELDREQRTHEREQRAHEREIKRIELELFDKKSQLHAKADLQSKPSVVQFRPKLPVFDESKDSLNSYIDRFERYAESQNWNSEDLSVYLGALLSGKALDVYVRLPPEQANDYSALKAALYHRFQLTEEGFRKKFFSAKPESKETASQFVFRLGSYLDRWVDLSGITKDFHGLRELILKEQFVSNTQRDLAVFIRERSPRSVVDTVRLAETFMEARNWTHLNRLNTSPGEKSVSIKEDTIGEDVKSGGPLTCYRCHEIGHLARQCKKRNSKSYTAFCKLRYSKNSVNHKCSVDGASAKLDCGCDIPVLSSCKNDDQDLQGLPICEGFVGSSKVKVLRDTGCSGVVVRRSLVEDCLLSGEIRKYIMVDRTVNSAPVAKIQITTPFFTGEIEAICMANPVCDLIIGNIAKPEATLLFDHESSNNLCLPEQLISCQQGSVSPVDHTPDKETANAVQTRCQSRKGKAVLHPLSVPRIKIPNITKHDLVAQQQSDKTLRKCRDHANNGTGPKLVGSGTEDFSYKGGVLFRLCSKSPNSVEVKQLVVPVELRQVVLQLGHDAIMAGHLGIGKTLDRILSNFYWYGITADADRFCKSCDICQKTLAKGMVPKVPVERMPLIDTPFSRVAADIVGPIEPRSTRGNKYILTVVDYATRYPEAVALPDITSERVAEALWSMFSRVGVPNEILTDNGSNFTSEMMGEFCRLMSIDQLRTTPYHAMCNGLVERFNGTLKRMLRKLCAERPSDWDRYVEPLLFAYREVPQDSLGFSPFELLYGRTVRGPLTILRELWTKDVPEESVRTTYEYVVDLRNRLETATQTALGNLSAAQTRYKANYDRKAVQRSLSAGDRVLLLLPSHTNKLLMQWRGPYNVVAKVGVNDYKIAIGTKVKVFHINMLKRYVERDHSVTIGLVAAIDDDPSDGTYGNEILLHDYPANTFEGYQDVNTSASLSQSQRCEIQSLVSEFQDIFSHVPGETDLVEHDIVLTSTNPITVRPYPVPHSLIDIVKSEIEDMISMGIVETSNSPYRSPLLMVRKKDQTFRPVIDFRKLNKVTVFDAEPMPNSDDIFAKVANSKFLTKLDFSKGYWQIRLSDDAKRLTAFYTPFGLYQFTRMPFGLINAGSSYNRMMRKLLSGMSDVDSFVDDLLVHTETWELHMKRLREVFERISAAKLTVKPSKCFLGYSTVEYLGHQIGNGTLSTLQDKVERIKHTKTPQTKKELRSFLGLSGYYQRFVPNYSTIAAPLTDLVRKGNPNRLVWEPIHENAFITLKTRLCSAPVLRLPDFSNEFVLRTDASDVGIGAVLLQLSQGVLHPIAYASRKLLPREAAYSAVEKECLAIVWAISKFQVYLFGQTFLLQTDHRPLSFVNTAKLTNPRIMRWALFLQTCNFRIEAIKGKLNVGADYLSRSSVDPT